MEEVGGVPPGAYEALEVIRLEAQMPTARFCRLVGVPERSYRRWQHRQRHGRPTKGPWPTPSADRIEPTAVAYADRYPQWGSRTIATLMRIDGHDAPDSTTYRALKRAGRVLEVTYQADRRRHAEARRAAFVVPPSGPNQVWQMDFSEFETRMGGRWQIGGCTDYWSKYELGWHVSPTQNQHDAFAAVSPLREAVGDRDRFDPIESQRRPRAPSEVVPAAHVAASADTTAPAAPRPAGRSAPSPSWLRGGSPSWWAPGGTQRSETCC